MNQLQTIFPMEKSDVRAKVVGHSLVASFRTSNPPTVWCLDLEKNHSFALAIQKRVEDWELGVMSPKGEFTVVARFDDRREVDRALASVEKAMFANPYATGAKVWRISAMTAAILGVILCGAWVFAWMQSRMNPDGIRQAMESRINARVGAAATPQPRTGVPTDADAVLGR
jgi:hypothetical protein